jgi:hypothetical protein
VSDPSSGAVTSAARAIAAAFADIPQVVAVALAGSQMAQASDVHSDLDLYICAEAQVLLDQRLAIAHRFAGAGSASIEIEKPFWGPEDAWIDRDSGLGVDLIYWPPRWIEEQLDRVLVHHQASVGYSTCFWYTILRSQPLFDREGWFSRLKQRADQPYPEALRRAVLALNFPVLRRIGSSYRHQLELAILRRDRVSVGHRIVALVASYFDILFALNRLPHPGEKRLVGYAQRWCARLPEHMERDLDALLCSAASPWDGQTSLAAADALLDALDALLLAEGMITANGDVI